MLPKIAHQPVHWQNGMKVAERHQRQQENAWLDYSRDAAHLNRKPWEYGLLPGLVPGQSGLDLEVTSETITMRQCRAITANGYRIELISGQDHPHVISLGDVTSQFEESPNDQFYLLLYCNPYDRRPSGQLDTREEGRSRHEFSYAKTRLEIKAVDKMELNQLTYLLPLAKLEVKESGFTLLKDFIPPVTTASALSETSDFEEDVRKSQQKILNQTSSICLKIRTLRQQQGVDSVAVALDMTAGKINFFLSGKIDAARLRAESRSPLDVIIDITSLVRVALVAMDGLPNRHELNTLIENHLGFKPHQIDNPLKELLLASYRHENIAPLLTKCRTALNILDKIFDGLNQLNQFQRASNNNSSFFKKK